MEFEIGKEMVNAGKDIVNRNIKGINFGRFKPYFNLTNEYILKKLILIIFPFNNKNWNIVMNKTGSIAMPDLYIPLMSFFTYILIKGIIFGLKNQFSPEKLGLVATRAIFLECAFVGISKLIGYFVDVQDLFMLDMFAFSGYKYFIIDLLLILANLKFVSIISMVYLNVAFFFFLSRSMKGMVFSRSGSNKQKKVYFLFAVVLLQMIVVLLQCVIF